MPNTRSTSPLSPCLRRCFDTIRHASALHQIQHLSPDDLDLLVDRWSKSMGLRSPSRLPRSGSGRVYLAYLENVALSLPVLLLIYQRHNRLQVHHVDAFFGLLFREGAVAGLLISTGGVTREAVRVASQFPRPIRCLNGSEWVTDLAIRRTGVGRRKLPCWVLDLQRSVEKRRSTGKEPNVSC